MKSTKIIQYALVDTYTNSVIVIDDNKKSIYKYVGRLNRKYNANRTKMVKVVTTTEYIEL